MLGSSAKQISKESSFKQLKNLLNNSSSVVKVKPSARDISSSAINKNNTSETKTPILNIINIKKFKDGKQVVLRKQVNLKPI